jgi:hypothetical protein
MQCSLIFSLTNQFIVYITQQLLLHIHLFHSFIYFTSHYYQFNDIFMDKTNHQPTYFSTFIYFNNSYGIRHITHTYGHYKLFLLSKGAVFSNKIDTDTFDSMENFSVKGGNDMVSTIPDTLI